VQRSSDLGGSSGEAADIAALVDRLGNRFSAGTVYRVAPVESNVPERAVLAVPPLAPSDGRGWTTPWPRPALLLPRPERITGEWWRRSSERAAVRDYWAVEDEDGCRFRLFRQGDGLDPATGGLTWFLHGFF